MNRVFKLFIFSVFLILSSCEIVEKLDDPARNTFKVLYTIQSDGSGYKIINAETKKIEYTVKPSQTKGVLYDVNSGDVTAYKVVKDGKHYRITTTSSVSYYYVMMESIYIKGGYDIFEGYDLDNAVYLIRGNEIKGAY